MSYSMLLIMNTILRISYDFLIRKKKHRYYISDIWISVLPTTLAGTENDLSFQVQGNRKNNLVHRVYPSLTKIEGMMNAPVLVQQFTHLVHPNRSYHLSYLLQQFADKTGKMHNNRKQTKHKRKNNEQTDSMCDKNISLFRKVMFHFDQPRSNCLPCLVEAVSRCCRPNGSLENSFRTPACTFEVVASSLSSTPTSDLNRIHSCSVPVKLKFKTPSILV